MHILTHLRWLTDDFGIWQHTEGDKIHREMGYALDDAARGLIVYLQFGDHARAKICLDYLEGSQTPKGFVGFFDQHRQPLSDSSSDDAHALAVWALAEAVGAGFHADQARAILSATSTKHLVEKGYLRTLAYLLLAYSALGDRQQAQEMAGLLLGHYDENLGWFEDRLTYANAALPWALLCYKRAFGIKNTRFDATVRQSIATLEEYSRLGVIPAPVGNRIWQRLGAVERDIYGQQPIDPGFMVLLLTEAYRAYRTLAYQRAADDWMQWFYGNNIFKASLITARHACVDGLYAMPRGICKNKGAESTIMYLLAWRAHQQLGRRS